jgi:hypothetical protein
VVLPDAGDDPKDFRLHVRRISLPAPRKRSGDWPQTSRSSCASRASLRRAERGFPGPSAPPPQSPPGILLKLSVADRLVNPRPDFEQSLLRHGLHHGQRQVVLLIDFEKNFGGSSLR